MLRMAMLNTLAAAALALAAPAGRAEAAAAAGPPPDKAADLVRLLGDNSYPVREKAAADLIRLGRSAKPALLAGTKDEDPEVRRRCQIILPRALRHDLEVRLEGFLADKEGKQKHELPGLDRFRNLLGSDDKARQLFADMLRADAELLEAADKDPRAAGDQLGVRAQALSQFMYNGTGHGQGVSAVDLANLLFVGADPKVAVPPQAGWQVHNLLTSQLPGQLTAGPRGALLKKLLLHWINERTDPNSITQTLQLAIQLQLKEGVEIALKELRKKDGNSYGRGAAILALGRLGGKEHRAVLEPLLTDAGDVSSFGINNASGKTQVRDVALAVLVHQQGQSLKDYGFAVGTLLPGFELSQQNHPGLLGFTDQKLRDAALKKWKEQAAKQTKQ
jgi:hypothetical protein